MNEGLKKLPAMMKETFQGWVLFSILILAIVTTGATFWDLFRIFFIENLGETFSVTVGILFWITVVVVAHIIKALLAKRRERKWHEEIKDEYKSHRDREDEVTQVVFLRKEPKNQKQDE